MAQTLTICKAKIDHLLAIKALADRHRTELGFVNRAKLEEVITTGRMLIGMVEEAPIGFLTYRHRKRDTQTTLSEICISREWQQRGIARQLMMALYAECQANGRTYIQLKCPVDLPANGFYQHLGFQHYATEVGRARQLSVWRMYLSPKGI